jgi:hypothetical protein
METFHHNTKLEINGNEKEYSNFIFIQPKCINHYTKYLIALGVHLLNIKKCFQLITLYLARNYEVNIYSDMPELTCP